MTQEQRAFRRAAIKGTLEKLGAVPDGTFEPRDSCVFLTTIEDRFAGRKGGSIMQVGKRAAAVLIVDGSHALSTESEIEAYHQDQMDRKCAARDAELKKHRRAIVFARPPAEEAPAPVDAATQLELEPATAEPGRKQ